MKFNQTLELSVLAALIVMGAAATVWNGYYWTILALIWFGLGVWIGTRSVKMLMCVTTFKRHRVPKQSDDSLQSS